MEYKVSERKKISVTIPSLGKTLSLNKPPLAAQMAYEDELKDATEKKVSVLKLMIKFLVGCGMPEELAGLLDNDEYTEVVNFVLGTKKN